MAQDSPIEWKRPRAVDLITLNCKDLNCYSVNITKVLFKDFDSDEENEKPGTTPNSKSKKRTNKTLKPVSKKEEGNNVYLQCEPYRLPGGATLPLSIFREV